MTTTRFAPSPTGYLHIGNLRAALMNYLIAYKADGTFILRIDDTDQERSKQEYIDGIFRDMEWLGLEWNRVEYQSKRLDRYHAAADQLREISRFYECFETPTELDLKRKKQLNMGKPPVYDRSSLGLSSQDKDKLRSERGNGHWRFRLDHERITWCDGILGDLSIDAASVSDPVLIRGDGQFLYTLASVVDDIEMGITDVVRGSDHVTNTATQIQMITALDGQVPNFAHHSLLTGPQGEALSKRLGTLALKDLRESGVEPQAIVSLMARLGSSQPVEIRNTLVEIAEGFELSQFGAAPTKFDAEDLYPLTQRFLRGLSHSDLAQDLKSAGVPDDMAQKVWSVIHDNVSTRKDIAKWWNIMVNGAKPIISDEDKDFVAQAMDMLPDQPFTDQTWSHWTTALKEASGRKGKSLFVPLRLALTGQKHGPDMGALMPLLQRVTPN